MTTKLEKQFFDIFKIPKRFILPVENFKYSYKNYKEAYKINRACNNWEHQETINELKKGKYEYPTITDHILLELICILSKWGTYLDCIYTIKAKNILDLKQDVLKDFLAFVKCRELKKYKESIKPQVQALFKEE